jgi:uncharacterized membrane protein YdbT with pleckstrin-like domain
MPITPGVYQHLGYRAYWMFYLRKAKIVFSPLIIALVIIYSNNYVDFPPNLVASFDQALIVLFGLFGIMFLASFLVSGFQYMAFEFMLDEHALKIRRGILNINIEAIPYRQMQNVDIERSILFRVLSVSRMVILTAGTEDVDTHNESEAIIPILDKYLATQVQEELLRRSNVEKTVVVPDVETRPAAPDL